jgi:hypothetical protein
MTPDDLQRMFGRFVGERLFKFFSQQQQQDLVSRSKKRARTPSGLEQKKKRNKRT